MLIRNLGLAPYEPTWQAMQAFSKERCDTTPDEIWLVEHPAVFTLGQAGKPEHILNAHNLPIIQSDRGGQVTYHGPGQCLLYVLLDIQKRNLTIRGLVCILEKAVIALLKEYKIKAYAKPEAPGVYVEEAKICSLGLRIRKGRSYHGLSLNVNMDLSPFTWINPCGYPGLKVVQLSDWVPGITVSEIAPKLVDYVSDYLERSTCQTPL